MERAITGDDKSVENAEATPMRPRAHFENALDTVKDDVLRLGALVESALE
jgi:hypothetical protein